MSIGKNIKNVRKNNNLTQEEFAFEIYCSVQSLSKWERNIKTPDVNILKCISNKFNVDIKDLIYDKPKKDFSDELLETSISMLSNGEIPSISKISHNMSINKQRIYNVFEDDNKLISFVIKKIDSKLKKEFLKITFHRDTIIKDFINEGLPIIIKNKNILTPLYKDIYTNGLITNYLKDNYKSFLTYSINENDEFTIQILLSIIMEIIKAALTYKQYYSFVELKSELYVKLNKIL